VTTLWYSAFSLPFPAYSFVATENCVSSCRSRGAHLRVARQAPREEDRVRRSMSIASSSQAVPPSNAGPYPSPVTMYSAVIVVVPGATRSGIYHLTPESRVHIPSLVLAVCHTNGGA
jgi:hypothetical protein